MRPPDQVVFGSFSDPEKKNFSKTRFSESELSNSSRKVVKNENIVLKKNRLVIMGGIFIFPTLAKFPKKKNDFALSTIF